jgi:hypothetical protein
MNKCQHYYAENYKHGRSNERMFTCIHCKLTRTLPVKDKEFYFGEAEVTKYWQKAFKT